MTTLFQKYIEICISFGKIGIFSFGGGNSMIKMLEFEFVNNRAWVNLEEFSQITGSTFLFPGLTAVKISTIIGFKIGGIVGAILAFLSINLPGIFLAVFGFYLLKSYQENPHVKKFIILIQYGSLAILAASVYVIGLPIFKSNFSPLYTAGAVVLLLSMIIFNFSPFLGLILYISLLYAF